MASAVRNPRYRGGPAVDGNLARELDWAVRERELRRAGEPSRRREADREALSAVLPQVAAEAVWDHFHPSERGKS